MRLRLLSHIAGGTWAGLFLVLGGIGGIMTSWNAFIVGTSRVLFAQSPVVPAVFMRLHLNTKTPYVGILTIGILSMFAPLVWSHHSCAAY